LTGDSKVERCFGFLASVKKPLQISLQAGALACVAGLLELTAPHARWLPSSIPRQSTPLRACMFVLFNTQPPIRRLMDGADIPNR
jgi:hypothetical protein